MNIFYKDKNLKTKIHNLKTNKGQAPPPILNRIKFYLQSRLPRLFVFKKNVLSPKLVGGQALLIVSAFVGIVLIFGFITVSNTTQFNRTINIIDERAMAKQAAEAGLAKSIWCLNQATGDNCGGTHGSSYAGESDVFIGNASFSTSITDKDSNTKTITSTGFFPNSTSTRYQIVIKQEAGIDTDNVSFRFAMQSGAGGIIMSNQAAIHGNVYSNGNIAGANSATINGDVYVAGGVSPTASVEWTTKNNDYIFGKEATSADIGQSFTVTSAARLNKVSLYIKKVGNPSNATIKIQTNSNGEPSGTTIGQGTLSAALVTGTITWIDFTLNSPPSLNANQTYWLVLDTPGVSVSNYWIIGQDTNNGYPSYVGKRYRSSNPSGWYDAGGDFNFKIWTGGEDTYVAGMTINGNAHAHKIDSSEIIKNVYGKILNNSTVGQDAYIDEIYNSTVTGLTYLGQGPNDPPSENMPISDALINEWKSVASGGEIINGDYTSSGGPERIMGPAKITGNLILSVDAVIRITGTIYVQGDLSMSNGAKIYLDSIYGTASGVIVVDGKITTTNTVALNGSGATGSVLMIVTANTANDAVNISNSANAGVFYAPYGGAILTNKTSIKELTAKQINMSNTAEIRYEQGLINTNFSSGPGGAWGLKTGTWRIFK